jgi:hypothetical protein
MSYSLFSHGTAKYLEIDEGIAIYNQNRFLNSFDRKYYGIFEGYFLVDFAKSHTYNELLDQIMHMCHYDLEKTFNKLARLKRGFRNIAEE